MSWPFEEVTYTAPFDAPWFAPGAGWPDTIPRSVRVPRTNLAALLDWRATETPEAPAIWCLGKTMTFRHLQKLSVQAAKGLHALGLKKGDVLALLLPNSFQYVVLYYAALRLGAIVTGVNPTYKPTELLHQLELCRADALVYLDALYTPIVAPVFSQLKLRLSISTNIADLLGLGAVPRTLGRWLGKIPSGTVHASSVDFRRLLRFDSALPTTQVAYEDTAVYLMTGGTTGVPKAAVLSHANCLANMEQCKLWMDRIDTSATLLGVIPVFHAFAMTAVMNLGIRAGCCMMLFPKPPATEELFGHLEKECADKSVVYFGAEVLFKRLADYPGIDKSPIKRKLLFGVSGAGPLHRPVQEKFERLTGVTLVEGYGLSEATPVVSCGVLFGERKSGSIGMPLPGTEWRIVDSANPRFRKAALPDGAKDGPNPDQHVGELAVHGPQVMQGYLGADEENAHTLIQEDGKTWLLTGDIGYQDVHGHVFLLDRKKELVKVSGYSVFPKDVESILGHHDAVHEVAVAGVTDSSGKEFVKAWVVVNAAAKGKVTPEVLVAWSRENMAHYKVPKQIEFVDEIPKNAIGKVLRRELVAREGNAKDAKPPENSGKKRTA